MPFTIEQLYKGIIFFSPPKTSGTFAVNSEEVKNWIILQQQWSRRIARGLLGVMLMWLLLIAWIFGWLPMWVPQPAYAIDLAPLRRENTELKSQIGSLQKTINDNDRSLRLGQLDPQLDIALTQYCLARRSSSQETVTLYFGKLRDLEIQYQRLTGEPYQREACETILIPVQ